MGNHNITTTGADEGTNKKMNKNSLTKSLHCLGTPSSKSKNCIKCSFRHLLNILVSLGEVDDFR